jgi:hypothetical protein
MSGVWKTRPPERIATGVRMATVARARVGLMRCRKDEYPRELKHCVKQQ